MWSGCTVEYYSVLNMEILKYVATWILSTIYISSVKWLLILNDFTCMIYGEWQLLGTGDGEEESLLSGDRISVWKMEKG